MAATGPHVIAAAARHAQRIDLTVGADQERLRWAVDIARSAAGDKQISLGAFLNVGIADDTARARDLVRGTAAIFARSRHRGRPADGLSEVTRSGIERLTTPYYGRQPACTRMLRLGLRRWLIRLAGADGGAPRRSPGPKPQTSSGPSTPLSAGRPPG